MNNIIRVIVQLFTCKIRIHKWNEWHYFSKESCKQIRSCKRCGLEESRLSHEQWSELEYIAPDSCERISICRRCGEKNSLTQHEWGNWLVVSEHPTDSSPTERFCKRCGASDSCSHPKVYSVGTLYQGINDNTCLVCGKGWES